MLVLSPALRNIFPTPMARYSLFVLKGALSTSQPTSLRNEGMYDVKRPHSRGEPGQWEFPGIRAVKELMYLFAVFQCLLLGYWRQRADESLGNPPPSSGNALVLINAVALHRARLVLGWVTAFG